MERSNVQFKCGKWQAPKPMFSFFVMFDREFAQDNPAEFETPTAGYWLLNAGIKGNWQTKIERSFLALQANNLLPTTDNYYDHLSKILRNMAFTILAEISLFIKYPFSIH
jgi:hypothetical protein